MAARSAAQSSRPIVTKRLAASMHRRDPTLARWSTQSRTMRNRRASAAQGPRRLRRPRWRSSAAVVDGRAAGGGTGAGGHDRRPGLRRRALPRRGGACASRRLGGRPCLLGVDIDPGAVTATRAAVADLATELGPLDGSRRARRRPHPRLGRCRLRPRRRQPAVPVAARRGARPVAVPQPPRRRALRRCRRRVPRPRRAPRPSRRGARRAGAAAVDPRLA